MRKCPFCAEDIQDAAIKCKHCGEIVAQEALDLGKQTDKEKKAGQKWYFKTSVIVIAFMCVGPLALPMLWYKPGLSFRAKIIWTVVVVILTVVSVMATVAAVKNILGYYEMIF